jgi:hypothetical protein
VYPDIIRLSKRHTLVRAAPLALFRRCYTAGQKKAVQGSRQTTEEPKMTWETPEFVEVKMDAEINSYQDDFGGDRDTGV